jgi:hypothetical protein
VRKRDLIYGDEVQRPPGTRSPRGNPQAVLALQHGAGNRSVAQLMRRKKVVDPREIDRAAPAGVSAADPLATVTPLPDADKQTVVADSAVGGGWTEKGGTNIESGRVGKIDRILLEGLSGRQQAQEKLSNVDTSGAGYARAVGQGARGHRGRAIALVPQAMRKGKGSETIVIVHFHGVDVKAGMLGSAGLRGLNDPKPEDVGDFQIPQQVEAYMKTKPDARVIVLEPVGITIQDEKSGLKDTFFGLPDVDTFVDECFAQLAPLLPKDAAVGPVYLSGHSGGGFEIERLLSDNRQPKKHRFAGVLGFETVHAGHAGTWGKLATDHLETDLKALEKLGDAKLQLAYLRDSGFHFSVFGGYGGYAPQVRAVRKIIVDWFTANEKRLDAAVKDQQVLDTLWRNYQAQYFAGSTHMNALSHDSNFGRALAALGG